MTPRAAVQAVLWVLLSAAIVLVVAPVALEVQAVLWVLLSAAVAPAPLVAAVRWPTHK